MPEHFDESTSNNERSTSSEADVPISCDLPHPLVFVTVGTTKFDALVSRITEENALNALKEQGYKSLLIQIGSGTILPNETNCKNTNMHTFYYRFKKSIKEDILRADLVISHAGAGTCFEVLSEKKPLLVVVNEELMDNHQIELAEKLSSENYLFACSCKSLVATIKKMELKNLKIMSPPSPNIFQQYLDKFMNLQGDK